eukprot:3828313-Pyramimonas_sp.AAC.1
MVHAVGVWCLPREHLPPRFLPRLSRPTNAGQLLSGSSASAVSRLSSSIANFSLSRLGRVTREMSERLVESLAVGPKLQGIAMPV